MKTLLSVHYSSSYNFNLLLVSILLVSQAIQSFNTTPPPSWVIAGCSDESGLIAGCLDESLWFLRLTCVSLLLSSSFIRIVPKWITFFRELRMTSTLVFAPIFSYPQHEKNKASAIAHPEVVDAYLQNEVALGRVAGPFVSTPLPTLHVSSFGVIPKTGQPGKWRLILDLS